jgi:hypothetical protein
LLFNPGNFCPCFIQLLTKFEQLLVTFGDSQIGSIPDDSYTIQEMGANGVISGQFNKCPRSHCYP